MQISTDVLTVLSTALAFPDPDRAVIVERLDRKAYTSVDKVLQALGGKWSKKQQSHVFVGEEPAEERIERVLATGTVTLVRDDLAFFPTPPKLAYRLATAAEVERGDTVLEPSAGMGALVEAAIYLGAAEVRCVERDATMRRALEDKFCASRAKVLVSGHDDFFDYRGDTRGQIDRVLMNPPFKKVGRGNHIDHVRHAHSLIRPGGRLAAIMPSGVTFREDRQHKEFRDFVKHYGGTITMLPEGSFKESGTGVNTCLVVVEA